MGKRETKAVSQEEGATTPIGYAPKVRGNEGAKSVVRFPIFRCPSFPFSFPCHALGVNENRAIFVSFLVSFF
jgi:hypothetical protein